MPPEESNGYDQRNQPHDADAGDLSPIGWFAQEGRIGDDVAEQQCPGDQRHECTNSGESSSLGDERFAHTASMWETVRAVGSSAMSGNSRFDLAPALHNETRA